MENNEEKLALARECIEDHIPVLKLKQRIREILAQSINQDAGPVIEVEKHLMRIRRWIQGVRRPFGMTKREILASADPAKRLHLEDLAGGIMEDMSVITNEIQQMLKIFAEMPKIPEIENPPPSEEA